MILNVNGSMVHIVIIDDGVRTIPITDRYITTNTYTIANGYVLAHIIVRPTLAAPWPIVSLPPFTISI